jgi:hypothetical protein
MIHSDTSDIKIAFQVPLIPFVLEVDHPFSGTQTVFFFLAYKPSASELDYKTSNTHDES